MGIRAKQLQGSTFDATEVDRVFTTAAIGLDRLEEAVIQADGGQAFTADQSMGGFKITNLAAPSAVGDAARKADVDAVAAGLNWKDATKAATTQDLASESFGTTGVTYANGTSGVGATLTQDDANDGAFGSLDGISISQGDRVLVKDQTSSLEDGVYELTEAGDGSTTPWVLTRVTDADESGELDSAAVLVQQGTTHADQQYVQTADAPTVGTTSLTWTRFGGLAQVTAGAGLTKTADTIDVGAGNGITVNADDVDVDPTALITGGAAEVDGDQIDIDLTPSNYTPDTSPAEVTDVDHLGAHLAGIDNALGSSGGTPQQESVTTENITGTDTALADTLNNTPTSDAAVTLYLNGILQIQGAGNDYSISGSTITWLASTGTAVDMDTTDVLIAIYES